MKDKYGQIMDRVKLTDPIRKEVLRNVLNASDPVVRPTVHSSAPRRTQRGWKRGLAAGLCAGAAAAVCFLAVPALHAPITQTVLLSNAAPRTSASTFEEAYPANSIATEDGTAGVEAIPTSTPFAASELVTERPRELVAPDAQATRPGTRPAAPIPSDGAPQPAVPAGGDAPAGAGVLSSEMPVAGPQIHTGGAASEPAPHTDTDGAAPVPDPDGGQPGGGLTATGGTAPASAVYTNEPIAGTTAVPAAVGASFPISAASGTLEALPEVPTDSENTAIPANATAPAEGTDASAEGNTTCAAGPQTAPADSPKPTPSPSPSPSPTEEDVYEEAAQAASS